jgi:hypothetical protein
LLSLLSLLILFYQREKIYIKEDGLRVSAEQPEHPERSTHHKACPGVRVRGGNSSLLLSLSGKQ